MEHFLDDFACNVDEFSRTLEFLGSVPFVTTASLGSDIEIRLSLPRIDTEFRLSLPRHLVVT